MSVVVLVEVGVPGVGVVGAGVVIAAGSEVGTGEGGHMCE